jgi:tetratricopeptide (TPR) repeat protein
LLEDRFGLALSTASSAAVEAYIAALDLMLSANAGAEPLLDDAVRLDPDFALAHIAKARLLQLAGHIPEAFAAANKAATFAPKLTEREREHIRIVQLAVAGKGDDAYDLLCRHIKAYPRDALPLSLALGVYGLLGFSGRIDHHQVQLELLESLAPDWGDDWWFLTYLGWSHVETGNHYHGIELIDRALEGNPRNGNAAHARGHGYYELGEVDQGRKFLTEWLPGYDRASQLHCHLSWHLAGFMLQQGEADQAMALYRDSIRLKALPGPSMLALVDCASLLWRAELYGYPPEPIDTREVADYALQQVPTPALGFFNIHIALALAMAGDEQALQNHLNEVDRLLAEGRQAAGPVVATLCEGIAELSRKEYVQAAECLEQAQKEMDRLGGSHAQRDVITDSLIIALSRSENPDRAVKALENRAGKRACHLDIAWLNRIRER